MPKPGGHNRITLLVDDLASTLAALRRGGAQSGTEIAAGVAVNTVLLPHPAGNPVELIEPRAGYHERASRDTELTQPDGPSTRRKEE